MKLIYINNTRLPSEKANSYQAVQMCSSFAKVFDEVELWTGKVVNTTDDLSKVSDIFSYYGVHENFMIKRLYHFDSVLLLKLHEFIWANIRDISFSINAIWHLINYKGTSDLVIYTRDWIFSGVYLLCKRLGLVRYKIIYESHKFSKKLLPFIKGVDGLVVINNFLGELHRKKKFQDILVAHDGVNVSDYLGIQKYKFKPNKNIINVVYTGSLFLWKGAYLLVDCLEFLPQNINLIFVGGSGEHLDNFKKYISDKSYLEQITLIPHLPKLEVIPYIENADILVLPNSGKYEMNKYTSPIKLFEYMASGRPIVASNIPSIGEVLVNNKNALLFHPDDAYDLADKIKEAIGSDHSGMIDNAFFEVQKYSWDNRAINIQNFLINL